MGELETYHLADFIPFGVEAYDRLFVGHNGRFFPAPVVGVLGGLLALWAAWRRRRWTLALLVPAWAWIGWAWYAQSYAALNWAGGRMAWMAWIQAGVMVALAHAAWRRPSVEPADIRGRRWAKTSLLLAAGGLLLYPLLDPLTGRGWRGVELFGHAPEPTALVTLGLVLAVGRWRAVGLLLPTLICLEGAATAWVLGRPGWWISPVAAATAWGLLVGERLRRRPAAAD